jgi:hypothetical protein
MMYFTEIVHTKEPILLESTGPDPSLVGYHIATGSPTRTGSQKFGMDSDSLPDFDPDPTYQLYRIKYLYLN